MHQKAWVPHQVAALFQVFQAHYRLTNMAHGSAAAQAVRGDAVAVANMMVASLTYTATIKAGPGGATLGLLRRSQLTSLMSQVHSTPVIVAWVLDSGPDAGHCLLIHPFLLSSHVSSNTVLSLSTQAWCMLHAHACMQLCICLAHIP